MTTPPVASTVDTLYDLASELLGFCAAALDELPAKAPERQYIAMGDPVLDCEQLTVHVFQVGSVPTSPSGQPLDTFQRRTKYPSITTSWMIVTIARECYPGPTGGDPTAPPEVADLDAAAVTLMRDGWLLWNVIPAALKSGELWGACHNTDFEPLRPLNPSGQIAGWTMPLLVGIDGYTPDLPA